MTTNEWETLRSGDGSLTFHRTVVDGRHVSLNMPGLAYVCGSAWSANRSGYPTFFGHTRADLLAYCRREGITLPELPEEWCPEPGWGAWRHERLSVTGNCATVCTRSDLTQNVRLFSDGSWGHREGGSPSGYALDIGKGHTASAYRTYAAEHGLPMPPADWWPELAEEPTEKPDAGAGMVQPPTLRDRLLNLADRMFYSDHTATFYAGELRDLAHELSDTKEDDHG